MVEKFPQQLESIQELKVLFLNYGIDQEKVRFFIEPEQIGPRMFGIFTDGDEFVVFKSKDDGKYVERYRGKDEKEAVNILYDRFLEECSNRQSFVKYLPDNYVSSVSIRSGNSKNTLKAKQASRAKKTLIGCAIFFVLITGFNIYRAIKYPHVNQGYYIKNNQEYYYRDNAWYYYDHSHNDWIYYGLILDDYDDYYYIDDYDYYDTYQDQNNFYNSDIYYDEYYEDDLNDYNNNYDNDNDSFSFDNDSWDFGSTDWGSDW